jgi:hypothetical protein
VEAASICPTSGSKCCAGNPRHSRTTCSTQQHAPCWACCSSCFPAPATLVHQIPPLQDPPRLMLRRSALRTLKTSVQATAPRPHWCSPHSLSCADGKAAVEPLTATCLCRADRGAEAAAGSTQTPLLSTWCGGTKPAVAGRRLCNHRLEHSGRVLLSRTPHLDTLTVTVPRSRSSVHIRANTGVCVHGCLPRERRLGTQQPPLLGYHTSTPHPYCDSATITQLHPHKGCHTAVCAHGCLPSNEGWGGKGPCCPSPHPTTTAQPLRSHTSPEGLHHTGAQHTKQRPALANTQQALRQGYEDKPHGLTHITITTWHDCPVICTTRHILAASIGAQKELPDHLYAAAAAAAVLRLPADRGVGGPSAQGHDTAGTSSPPAPNQHRAVGFDRGLICPSVTHHSCILQPQWWPRACYSRLCK